MPGGGRAAISVATIETPALVELQSGPLEPGRYVRISVMDNGSGMPEPVRRRALDPFFTTKAPGQGFGLGLALARAFAIESGGGINIESAPGGGTIAMLYLKSR